MMALGQLLREPRERGVLLQHRENECLGCAVGDVGSGRLSCTCNQSEDLHSGVWIGASFFDVPHEIPTEDIARLALTEIGVVSSDEEGSEKVSRLKDSLVDCR